MLNNVKKFNHRLPKIKKITAHALLLQRIKKKTLFLNNSFAFFQQKVFVTIYLLINLISRLILRWFLLRELY